MGELLVDVSDRAEFAERRIPGSINHPLDTLDPAALSAAAVGRRIVLVSRGSRRAQVARAALAVAGIDAVVLPGGVSGWMRAGGRVTGRGEMLRRVAAGAVVVAGVLLALL